MAKSESKNRSLDKLEVVSWLQRLNTSITNHGKKPIVIEPGETCYLPNLFFNRWADGADIDFAKKKVTLTIKKKINGPVFKNTDAAPKRKK
jgi:hypothetical protein